MRRREDMKLGKFCREYLGGGAAVGLILVIMALIIGFGVRNDQRQNAESVNLFMKALDEPFIEDRKDDIGARAAAAIKRSIGVVKLNKEQRELAFATIVAMQDEFGGNTSMLSKVIRDHKEKIQKNPELESVPFIPIPIPSWKGMLNFISILSGVIFWLSLFISYISFSSESSERLVDLPWKKPWAWIFFALTLPIGFPFYISSANNWLRYRRRERRREQERAEALAKAEARRLELTSSANVERRASQMAQEREVIQERTEKIMDPESLAVSRENWQTICGGNNLARWEQWMKIRQDKITNLKSGLAELGKKICAEQEKLAEAHREIREWEKAKPQDKSDSAFPLTDDDFKRLLSFSIVQAAEVLPNEISVWTNPVIFEHDGKRYDLGSYLVKVSDINDKPSLKVVCIVSGRLDGERSHFYGGLSGGGFCFGTRGSHIKELLKKSEYLAALDLVFQGISYVNESNWPWLSDLMEVTDEKQA
jgi:hypothetical protein